MPLPPPPAVAPPVDLRPEVLTLWVADDPTLGDQPRGVVAPGPTPRLHAHHSADDTTTTISLEGRGFGPVYVSAPGGNVVRVRFAPDDAGWALDLLLRGSNVTAWRADRYHPDPSILFTGHVQLHGDRLRPVTLDHESPAAVHLYRHRTMQLRTARVARWWPTVSDEVETMLPDGWTIAGDHDANHHLDHPDMGTVGPLVPACYVLVEDHGGALPVPHVLTALHLARQWQQITGPTVVPAPPPTTTPTGDTPE